MKNINVKNKIILLGVLIIAAFFVFTLLYVVPTAYNEIEARTIEKTLNITETAYSIVKHNYEQYKSGKISEEKAKEAAMQTIKHLRYGKDGYVWINDYDQVMVMHPTNPKLDGQSMVDFEDPNGFKLFGAMAAVVKEKGEGEIRYEWPKPGFDKPQPKISYVKGFEEWQWIIGTGVYVDDLDGVKFRIRNNILLFCIIIILVSVLLMLGIVIPLNKSMKKVLCRLDSIASGDFSDSLDMDQKDEMGLIAKSVNALLANMRLLFSNVLEIEERVYTSSTHVKQSLDDLSSGSEQIALTVSELAKGATEQAGSVDAVSNQVSSIVKSLEKIDHDITDSEKLLDNAVSRVFEGEKSVELQEVKMTESRKAVQSVSSAVNQLLDKSNAVGEILVVINQIAEQTNLLSLNAAIEAARAGEMGKGFAVVANEVRKLAEQSAQSVKQIESLIVSMQQGVTSASQEMTKVDAIVDEQNDALAKTIVSFNNIRAAVQSISENIKSIASASGSLAENAKNVELKIMNMASISQEAAAGTEEMAASTQQQTATLQQVSEAVNNMSEQMNKLNENIKKFKV
ncbi:MAG: methyl-accepting chemotaxis protein [Bacillota bacterium]